MKRTILAVIAAAVVSFMWGFVSWTVLPWHNPRVFSDPDAVAAVLKANAPEHDFYLLPNTTAPMSDKAAMDNLADETRRGPYVFAMVRPGPGEWNMNRNLALSFLRGLLSAILLTALIKRLASASIASRVGICLLAALVVCVNSEMPIWTWYEQPTKHTLALCGDYLVDALLMGLVLGLILKPPGRAHA